MELPTQGIEQAELRNRDWTLMESFEALDPSVPNLTMDSGLHEQLNIFLGFRSLVHSVLSSCISHFINAYYVFGSLLTGEMNLTSMKELESMMILSEKGDINAS